MDLFNAFAEPKSEVKLEYLTDELEDALQVTQIATTPVQSNLEDEQIRELLAYNKEPHLRQVNLKSPIF